MSTKCAFCDGPVNPHDLGTWKEVVGWVGGPRKDGMTLREDSGRYAHDACILKARKGQSADQPELLPLKDGIDDTGPIIVVGHGDFDPDNEQDMADLEELLEDK